MNAVGFGAAPRENTDKLSLVSEKHHAEGPQTENTKFVTGAVNSVGRNDPLSVAPEDIAVARTATAVHLAAIIRNSGNANSRGAHVMISAAVNAADGGITRSFVVDVPTGGTTEVKLSMPFSAPYGAVVAQVMQISEHTPHDSWNPDPTPDDTVAFCIIGPQHAPKGFAASLIQQCGPICRGF